MDKLTLAQLQAVDSRFGDDVLEVFDYERSVEMKAAIGGTSKSAVLEQIATLQKALGGAQVHMGRTLFQALGWIQDGFQWEERVTFGKIYSRGIEYVSWLEEILETPNVFSS